MSTAAAQHSRDRRSRGGGDRGSVSRARRCGDAGAAPCSCGAESNRHRTSLRRQSRIRFTVGTGHSPGAGQTSQHLPSTARLDPRWRCKSDREHRPVTVAAPVHRTDHAEYADGGPDRSGHPGPDSIHTPKGNAARVAHLIVISDLEYADGTFLSADRPKNWHVYSPQGVDVNKTGVPVLDELMEEAAIRLAKMGYRRICLHAEQRIIIDDEPLRVVRVQTSPPSDARLHTSRLFLSQFTPEFYREGVGEDLEQKARIRKDFERDFPQSATGEMLFVVAESTDSYGWLQDQTLPYMPYTIVAHLPEADRHFFASVYYDHVGVKTGTGLVSFDELGIQRDTTVGEFAQRLEHHRRSTSLPAAGRQ